MQKKFSGNKNMKPDLQVKIGTLKLKNPVMVASGTFGAEYRELVDVGKLGAIVTKTITLNGRAGNPAPRVAEASSGMLNSIGLENKGLEDFINKKIPAFPGGDTKLIVSIAGDTEGEFTRMVGELDKVKKVSAIEINLSCPNVKHGSRTGLTAQDEDASYSVVRAVRRATGLPIIAKLTPNVTDIAKIAVAVEKAGADAILAVNTFAAMAIDIETRRPKLGNVTGGLSGPAIKPIALKMIWDIYNKVEIPIIGVGGIMNYKDAVEFMLCGAAAIQVGTATFVNPNTAIEIIKGLNKYCSDKNIKNMSELVGNINIGRL
ncbi:MAG: dihydroorotate dehydrogenase [Candidatus Omnitrophota bacterium]